MLFKSIQSTTLSGAILMFTYSDEKDDPFLEYRGKEEKGCPILHNPHWYINVDGRWIKRRKEAEVVPIREGVSISSQEFDIKRDLVETYTEMGGKDWLKRNFARQFPKEFIGMLANLNDASDEQLVVEVVEHIVNK
jgi:hypothetical protein